jgi:hypothetical protein
MRAVVFFRDRQVFPPASSTLSKPSRAAPRPLRALRWSPVVLWRPVFFVFERPDLAEALPATFFLAGARFLLALFFADFLVAAIAASELAWLEPALPLSVG